MDDLAVSHIPDRVRQQVVEWPGDAPRGAVGEFCRRHGVSTSWFHAVRARALEEGSGALVKRSTRPLRSPTATSDGAVAAVIAMRRRLMDEGKDHGPHSILDALERAAFEPLPSRSTIARILDRAQLVERNKRKRPKRSLQRIRSEFPNQRWQADGLEVTLTTGEVVTVIEIIDDCTRFNIGLCPGSAESSQVVVEAFRDAIDRYGRPVLVHTDNGTAFNQARLGKTSALQTFLSDLGVKMITGRPNHPQSQGKVERAHRTLLAFIAIREPATLEQLSQVLEEYRAWFNHDRSHQALPPRTAPADLYETLPKIAPPGDPITPTARHPARLEHDHDGELLQHRTTGNRGTFRYRQHTFLLGKTWAGQRITILRHHDRLDLFDRHGELITSPTWPRPRPSSSLARQIDRTPPEPDSPLCPETQPSTMS